MTTVASAYPLITAFRMGNDVFVGGEPGRNCEITRPFVAISSCKAAFCGVDARGETADYGDTPRGETCRQIRCLQKPLRRRLPGPDNSDRHGVMFISGAAQEQHWRTLVDHPEVRRVLPVRRRPSVSRHVPTALGLPRPCPGRQWERNQTAFLGQATN